MRKVREKVEDVDVEHRFHNSLVIRKSQMQNAMLNLEWQVRDSCEHKFHNSVGDEEALGEEGKLEFEMEGGSLLIRDNSFMGCMTNVGF